METRNITITKELYKRLLALKGSNKNMNDTINKLTRKYSILELVGTLSEEEAKEIKSYTNEIQKRLRN